MENRTFYVHQGRQCRYNVTYHCGAFVRPLLQWRSNTYNVFRVPVCSLRYPACNAHAPCCHLWPVLLYSIFHIISHAARFSKREVTEHKMSILDFLCKFFFSETFLVLNRTQQRDMVLQNIDVRNQQDAAVSIYWSFYWSIWIFSTCFGRQTNRTEQIQIGQ